MFADSLEIVDGQAALSGQVEEHARIEIAAAGPHQDATGGGEAHRRVDGAAVLDRHQAGAVPEVSDDDAGWRLGAQGPHHLRVRETVEPVAADLVAEHRLRQRQPAGELRQRRVKGGVEAGDLGHARPPPERGPHPGQRRRLMQRRQRDERLQVGEQLRVHAGRAGVPAAAMDDPMGDQRWRSGQDAGHQLSTTSTAVA